MIVLVEILIVVKIVVISGYESTLPIVWWKEENKVDFQQLFISENDVNWIDFGCLNNWFVSVCD